MRKNIWTIEDAGDENETPQKGKKQQNTREDKELEHKKQRR